MLGAQPKLLQGNGFVNKLRLTFVPFALAEFVIYCNRQQFSFLEREESNNTGNTLPKKEKEKREEKSVFRVNTREKQ